MSRIRNMVQHKPNWTSDEIVDAIGYTHTPVGWVKKKAQAMIDARDKKPEVSDSAK